MELNNKIFEILKDLVALDTTSRNSNLPVIEYIENYLEVPLSIISTGPKREQAIFLD